MYNYKSKKYAYHYLVVGFILSLMVLFGYAWLSTSSVETTIIQFTWKRTINIENFMPRERSDWEDDVSSDAYDNYESQKIHHYDHITDGFEQVQVQKSERYQSGTSSHCSNHNNGDGTITQICEDIPTYSTRYWTETETVQKYKDVPVYDTWVEYKVNRWEYFYSEMAEGFNRNPYWPSVQLIKHDVLRIGDTRESGRTQKYWIIIQETDSKMREWTVTVNYPQWMSFLEKERIIAKVNMLGVVTSYEKPRTR